MEISRTGVFTRDIHPTTGEDGSSSHVPWSAFVALEYDDVRYYFWGGRRQALVLGRDSFDSDSDEEHRFRNSVERWAGRPFISPPIYNRQQRRQANWDFGL
ncbi:hypothetical protein [Fulvimarina sp. MAC8]|uniref:hypothetical protein n=1 Tax=Fulvimarina sp. MAC8 TaxID=3162874 RepID=UPI0032ED7464